MKFQQRFDRSLKRLLESSLPIIDAASDGNLSAHGYRSTAEPASDVIVSSSSNGKLATNDPVLPGSFSASRNSGKCPTRRHYSDVWWRDAVCGETDAARSGFRASPKFVNYVYILAYFTVHTDYCSCAQQEKRPRNLPKNKYLHVQFAELRRATTTMYKLHIKR